MTFSDNFKRHRASRGGDAFGRSPLRFAPYRRIVGEEQDPTATFESVIFESVVEVLECGHHLRSRRDLIGVTYPERRRCGECLREACEGAGHPLVEWLKEVAPARSWMRCKCGQVDAGRAGPAEVAP